LGIATDDATLSRRRKTHRRFAVVRSADLAALPARRGPYSPRLYRRLAKSTLRAIPAIASREVAS